MITFRKLIAAAAAATLSTAAMAADVTIQSFTTLGESDIGDVTTSTGTAGGPAVEFNITTTTGNTFAAYCLEVDSFFGGSGNSYNISSPTQDAIARLFAVSGFNGVAFAADGVDTATKASALQLAIWEVVADNLVLASTTPSFYTAIDTDLAGTADDGNGNWIDFNAASAGNFRATGFSFNAVSQATDYLNAAAGLSIGSYATANVQVLTNVDDPHHQNLVTAVPEPSTYALMAACLGVVGFVARRKQQA